jgi:CDP-diacylglycerol pyrophosphatase
MAEKHIQGKAAHRVIIALLLALAVAPPACASGPNALWKIVNGQCVPDERADGKPAPCTEVALEGGEARGWAVLKDRRGKTQFLLIPTARVTGIEDPVVLAPDAPNWWQAAWSARGYVMARAGRELPRDALSLAINAPTGRTQEQLHIHVDCLRPDVRDALRARAHLVGEDWAPLGIALAGHDYRARRLDGAELGANDPFRLLAAAPGVGAAGMADETLVVVGATFAGGVPGFLLLADHVDLAAGDRGSGEELQDHDCALAETLPR